MSEGGRGHAVAVRAAVAALVIVAIAVGARVWWVNANAFSYERQGHEMGDWVELDGAFVDYASEGTSGYALRVVGAQLMTCGEYLELYGAPSDAAEPLNPEYSSLYERLGPVNPEAPLVSVALEIRNEGEGEGALNVYGMRIAIDGSATACTYNQYLWSMTRPDGDPYALMVSVPAGQSFVVHLPYMTGDSTGHSNATFALTGRLLDQGASLVVSNAPVRHSVRIEVD